MCFFLSPSGLALPTRFSPSRVPLFTKAPKYLVSNSTKLFSGHIGDRWSLGSNKSPVFFHPQAQSPTLSLSLSLSLSLPLPSTRGLFALLLRFFHRVSFLSPRLDYTRSGVFFRVSPSSFPTYSQTFAGERVGICVFVRGEQRGERET